jgi:ligand-binding sensor domain-containing protein
VKAIHQDRNSRLWIGSDDGLYLFDERKQSFAKPFPEMFNPKDFVYNTIPSIIEDRVGNLWIGTTNGAFVYEHKTSSFRRFSHDDDVAGSLSDNNVRKIVEDHQGRIWIATYGGGVNLFQPASGTFRTFKYDPSHPEGISSNLIPSMWVNDDGRIWIGTDGKGIDILDPDNLVFHHITHSPYNSKSLNNNVIRSISGDHRGGVWVGTYNGGVNFFNQNAEAFFHYKVPTINGNSSITSFAEEKNGNLWIGTDGGGLCYFNRETGQFYNFYQDEKNANSLSDNRVLSLLLDHENTLWIGTYLGGLCRYNLTTRKFIRYSEKDNSGLSDDVIWTLLLDHRGKILAGTNKGLNVFDPKTKSFTSVNINNSNLSNNMIRCMYEDTQHRLWIGTQSGLNLLEKPYNRFKVILTDQEKVNTLSNHWIRTINEDHQGNLWIGTFSGGLNLFDEGNDSFISYQESDGLPDNIVSGILGDENNNLWVSTGRGLAFLDFKTKKFRSYTVSDGLQDYQFNINACFKTQKGEFLFGGNNGFTLFVPEIIRQVDSNKFAPQVALTSFKIFNKEVVPQEVGSPLKEQINETKKIVLSHDQSVLTFEFTALNFIQPEKNQYAYRLAGFEEDWNMVGNKRSATYTNLEPAKYTFQVKASNNDGVWNEEGVSVDIVITPPFWGTWWFKTLMTLVACATGLTILNIVRKRIREKIRINKLIAELELKALIAQMNPHFIFNCLTSIQELIVVAKHDEAMHYLHQFSRLLRTVLQSSDKNFIPLDEELTLLELYLELEAMRFDQEFHYNISVDDAIDAEEIVIPSFLLQPFLENALWHGLMHKKGDRNLNVSFRLETEDILVCTISDNGIGREQATTLKKKSLKTYKSMGIRIIRERMALMKKQNSVFDLRIVDEKDPQGNAAGTTVIVRLPLRITAEMQQDKAFEIRVLEEAAAPGLMRFDK